MAYSPSIAMLYGAVGSDLLGSAVSAAGDVNGDGYDDVIIGAPFADPNGTNSGSAWVVYGSHRLMCEELQVRTQPFALLAFCVFATGLVAGFLIDADTAPSARLWLVAASGLVVALAAAYFSAFALRGDPLLPRRLALDARRGDWTRVGAALPLWGVALGYAGLCALVARVAIASVEVPLPFDFILRVPAGALPVFLYAARDMVVLFAIGCTVRAGRTELVALIYLALAYWLLPAILTLGGAGAIGRLLAPMPWIRPDAAALILGEYADGADELFPGTRPVACACVTPGQPPPKIPMRVAFMSLPSLSGRRLQPHSLRLV
jgi:hypothetical protein